VNEKKSSHKLLKLSFCPYIFIIDESMLDLSLFISPTTHPAATEFQKVKSKNFRSPVIDLYSIQK